MDGNGRWAQKRFMPRTVGHAKGASTVRQVLQSCVKSGVKYLTLFAFSTENWKRPQEEVSTLMLLFVQYLESEIKAIQHAGVQFKVIGEVSCFSHDLQQRIKEAETATAKNTGVVLTVAANYGGKWDIVQAVRRWQFAHPDGDMQKLTPDDLAKHLSTNGMPEPDLLIRTGGERRISNFLLWQCAYSEFYFTNVLWPDFDESEFLKALDWYAARSRRFGQLESSSVHKVGV